MEQPVSMAVAQDSIGAAVPMAIARACRATDSHSRTAAMFVSGAAFGRLRLVTSKAAVMSKAAINGRIAPPGRPAEPFVGDRRRIVAVLR